MTIHYSHNISDSFYQCYGCGMIIGNPKLEFLCPTPDHVGKMAIQSEERKRKAMTKRYISLVGSTHSSLKSFLPLKKGMNLLLLREPANPFDPNAIRAYVDVGYISAGGATIVAPMMDAARTEMIEGVLDSVGGTICSIEIEESQPAPTDRGDPEKAYPLLLAACKRFVEKCDNGLARSVESYAQMKDAIAVAEGKKETV
jgi:hypothetical protein